MTFADPRPDANRPSPTESNQRRPAHRGRRAVRRAALGAALVTALVAAFVAGPVVATADDGTGTGGRSSTSSTGSTSPTESPASVQGAPPAATVDPSSTAQSSEWIVLCTSFSPCKSAGYGNDGYDGVYRTSFWSQYSGHNCTNYVAYRMIRNGMSSTRPAGAHGYARDWGVGFASQTNDTPAVGSVAWWDTSFSASGHVAYVERVVSSSEIYVSEDNWGGDFRWRKVTRSGGRWPQGFIHLKDVATSTGPYQAIQPSRIVDTRTGLGGTGSVSAGGEITVQVAGRGGLPSSGVSSVVLNVTVVRARSGGHLLVYPSGSTRPNSSTLNYPRGATVANQAVTRVGSDGRVRLYSSGSTDVVIDVSGYYGATSNLTTVTPKRMLDTRTSTGGHPAKLKASESVDVSVTGSGAASSAAAVVVLNVTVNAPTATGRVTVWQSGAGLPSTSNLNYRRGDTLAGMVLAKVGSNGRVTLRSTQDAHLIVDVLGWAPAGSDLAGVSPARLLDSRLSSRDPMNARSTTAIQVSGRGGVPAGVKAVLLNVVAVTPSASGMGSVYASGTSRPVTSTINYAAGQTIANSVLAKVGSDGYVRVYLSASAHLVVDVQGYVSG